jgi:outer membrane protein
MKTRKIFAMLILCAFYATGLQAAETIPKIGVLNRKKVTQSFFKESKTLRDLEAEKAKADEYIQSQLDEIKNLESKKVEAQKNHDDENAFKLANDIKKKEEYLREYNRVTFQQYNDKLQKLYYSGEFVNELYEAIENVALSEGISIVLDSTKSEILFCVPEVDITDKVIEALLKNK